MLSKIIKLFKSVSFRRVNYGKVKTLRDAVWQITGLYGVDRFKSTLADAIDKLYFSGISLVAMDGSKKIPIRENNPWFDLLLRDDYYFWRHHRGDAHSMLIQEFRKSQNDLTPLCARLRCDGTPTLIARWINDLAVEAIVPKKVGSPCIPGEVIFLPLKLDSNVVSLSSYGLLVTIQRGRAFGSMAVRFTSADNLDFEQGFKKVAELLKSIYPFADDLPKSWTGFGDPAIFSRSRNAYHPFESAEDFQAVLEDNIRLLDKRDREDGGPSSPNFDDYDIDIIGNKINLIPKKEKQHA